jgi:O-acetyl-ADP-ribose deacetylase (regulator of RNase III)
MKIAVGSTSLELVQGDITVQDVDAIVNAANDALAPGGGVCGAIYRVGGAIIFDECSKYNGCPTGEARITGGGNLKARHVIHAVGPIYGGGARGEAELLASAYRSSLQLAVENSVKSIAFPALSAGIYGYPLHEAAQIALSTTIEYLREHPNALDLVRFVLFDDKTRRVFGTELEKLRSNLQI